MSFKAVNFSIDPSRKEFIEILYAMLDANGFNGITEEDQTIVGYIYSANFKIELLTDIRSALSGIGCSLSWSIKDIADQNWNSVWESNFEPIVIQDRCAIRAPFHPEFPFVQYQITIEPKMSFGTGHHHTTRLMIEQMMDCGMKGMKILDMGCGTGILSILASKLGAASITAIDIDVWAYENSIENIAKNNIHNVRISLGGKEIVPDGKFDIILANINRNTLLDQMVVYSQVSDIGGILLISGFLNEDISILKKAALNAGFSHELTKSSENWALMMFKKI
jgi:ribosomal protein L11 methyltransferase